MVIWLFVTLLAGSCVSFSFRHPLPIYFPWASLTLSNPVFLWAFTNSFGLPWPNYFIPHPWGSWTCHQPFTFFACITLGLLWPILTFLHHILPMGLPILSLRAPLGPQGPFVHFMGLQSLIPAAWV